MSDDRFGRDLEDPAVEEMYMNGDAITAVSLRQRFTIEAAMNDNEMRAVTPRLAAKRRST